MPVKLIRQYTVFIPNIPGALSKFVELFAKEGVNIIGIASEIRDDSGVVRIAIDADRKLSHVLTGAGFTTIETSLISLELPDKPGQLLRLTMILGANNINITTVYGTSVGGAAGRLLLNVSDGEKALDVLKAELELK
ncbi:MAG: hypothetical protein A2X34_04140 [Elusimicrobia bacterium GWC2_51_8]|nr:MAG: hypothetical protein A2X33_01995 [Elusimicrobia bacterium GWA2_51_34]OGR60073.1 MAG: hypothetical protein A2X34_04140 [Elusimicrobia bacterium GWC2_51_8]OGR85134.1 MAG: hypothetical protein A2021_09405 [Elusimicrobia bacterium GWF2_52_66]HAF94527.1 hypothetical protein [Elusimicrobiota bacterium]HCE97907.1 hypothetical protein [Elusimicrobiota bacterium]